MAILPLRALAERPIASAARDWLAQLGALLADPSINRNRLCREILTALWYPEHAADWESAVNDSLLPLATRFSLESMDPCNVTLEPEYYSDCDQERFQRVKPLLWLWYSFDRTALGGQNVWLGVELRRLLARHIFKRCGE